MTEENQSFWSRVFSTEFSTEREQKVLEYIMHRVGEGAHLRDVTQEEYVRRHASPNEVDDILENPKLIESAHEHLRQDFSPGGNLDLNQPPSSPR